jgi:hypothetical protein
LGYAGLPSLLTLPTLVLSTMSIKQLIVMQTHFRDVKKTVQVMSLDVARQRSRMSNSSTLVHSETHTIMGRSPSRASANTAAPDSAPPSAVYDPQSLMTLTHPLNRLNNKSQLEPIREVPTPAMSHRSASASERDAASRISSVPTRPQSSDGHPQSGSADAASLVSSMVSSIHFAPVGPGPGVEYDALTFTSETRNERPDIGIIPAFPPPSAYLNYLRPPSSPRHDSQRSPLAPSSGRLDDDDISEDIRSRHSLASRRPRSPSPRAISPISFAVGSSANPQDSPTEEHDLQFPTTPTSAFAGTPMLSMRSTARGGSTLWGQNSEEDWTVVHDDVPANCEIFFVALSAQLIS